LCETESGKLVATSLPCLTAHSWIADDFPVYLKFALKVTQPFRTRRFREISLNKLIVPQA